MGSGQSTVVNGPLGQVHVIPNKDQKACPVDHQPNVSEIPSECPMSANHQVKNEQKKNRITFRMSNVI